MTSPFPAVPLDWDAATGDPEQPIPFGIDPDGNVLSFDRRTTPHLLVSGATGSGKSKFVQAYIAGAVARGEDVVVIDTEKGGREYQFAIPRLRGFAGAGEYEEAASLCEDVYSEGMARAHLIREHGVSQYALLPDDVRPPRLTLIVDNVPSLVSLQWDQGRIRTDHVAAELAAEIIGWVGRLSREGRFAGISVIVAGQFDGRSSSAVGRSNFGRLALGQMSEAGKRIALRSPESAPVLGVFTVAGQGTYEPNDGEPTAVHCWAVPSDPDELAERLAGAAHHA